MKLYVDGVLESSATGSVDTLNATAWLRLGQLQTGFNEFAGLLDEVSLYGVVLSPDDVLERFELYGDYGAVGVGDGPVLLNHETSLQEIGAATPLVTRRTDTEDFFRDPTWSPDGSLLAYVRGEYEGSNRDLVIAESTGLNARMPIPDDWGFDGYDVLDVDFSPDGDKIAFSALKPPNASYRMLVARTDGTDLGQLTDLPADSSEHELSPSWSPDGSSIAFVTETEVRTLALASGEQQVVYTVPPGDHLSQNVDWSPGGLRLLFTVNRYTEQGEPVSGDVRTVRPDGTGLTLIRNEPATHLEGVEWSASGERILFSRTVAEGSGYVTTAASMWRDGTGLQAGPEGYSPTQRPLVPRIDCNDGTLDESAGDPSEAPTIYTCTVTSAVGSPLSGMRVDAENLKGNNDPDFDGTGGPSGSSDFSCTTLTNSFGQCQVPVPGYSEGQAKLCFWIDADDDSGFHAAGSTLGAMADGAACDAEPIEEPEANDGTDVVWRAWDTTPPANPEFTASHSSAWSANRVVTVTGFQNAWDIESDIDGFSWLWDTTPTSVPDMVVDGNPNNPYEGSYGEVTKTLPSGTHYFHVRTMNRRGLWSEAVHVGPLRVDARAPTRPTLTAPAAPFALTQAVTAKWGAVTDEHSGMKAYNLLRSITGVGATAAGNYTGQALTTPLTTSATTPSEPGKTYCFKVRARDRVGNASPYTSPRCTAAPLDDAALTRSGVWATRTQPGSYLDSSISVSSIKGAGLQRTDLRAVRQLALVATRCPTCGAVKVLLNGIALRPVGAATDVISLYASSERKRELILFPVLASPTDGTVTVRVVSDEGAVKVEGLGVRR